MHHVGRVAADLLIAGRIAPRLLRRRRPLPAGRAEQQQELGPAHRRGRPRRALGLGSLARRDLAQVRDAARELRWICLGPLRWISRHLIRSYSKSWATFPRRAFSFDILVFSHKWSRLMTERLVDVSARTYRACPEERHARTRSGTAIATLQVVDIFLVCVAIGYDWQRLSSRGATG